METPKTKPNISNSRGNRVNDNNRYRGGNRKSRSFFEKPKPEFEQKIISIRRVTRVVKGGRRMTFAVAMAIGDKKGSIGLGTGKGGDISIAINKAIRQAKKTMFKIKTTKEMSIFHEISDKFSSSKLNMMPNRGGGLVAGSTVRDILMLAGLKNITAKFNSRSKNKLNNARVTYKALYQFKMKNIIPKDTVSVPKKEPEKKDDNEIKNIKKD